MAKFKFTFTNTQDGQTITVTDQLDSSANPIFQGPLNHDEVSSDIYCWVGDNGHGTVQVKGDQSIALTHDVDKDGDTFDY